MNLLSESNFILAKTYGHQRLIYNALAIVLTSWLVTILLDLFDYVGLEGAMNVPIVLVGYFNLSDDYQNKLNGYLHKHFCS